MRFEKLMEHFKNEDDNIDFLVQTVLLIFFFFHIQFILLWKNVSSDLFNLNKSVFSCNLEWNIYFAYFTVKKSLFTAVKVILCVWNLYMNKTHL